MMDARLESRWDELSFLGACALNANPFRKEPVEPKDINPLAKKKKKPIYVPMENLVGRMERDGFFAK